MAFFVFSAEGYPHTFARNCHTQPLMVRLFGRWLGFGVVFWFGVRFDVDEDLGPEVRGRRCRLGGFPGVLPGCLGRLCGDRGVPGSLACGRSFGLCRGPMDEVGGEFVFLLVAHFSEKQEPPSATSSASSAAVSS